MALTGLAILLGITNVESTDLTIKNPNAVTWLLDQYARRIEKSGARDLAVLVRSDNWRGDTLTPYQLSRSPLTESGKSNIIQALNGYRFVSTTWDYILQTGGVTHLYTMSNNGEISNQSTNPSAMNPFKSWEMKGSQTFLLNGKPVEFSSDRMVGSIEEGGWRCLIGLPNAPRFPQVENAERFIVEYYPKLKARGFVTFDLAGNPNTNLAWLNRLAIDRGPEHRSNARELSESRWLIGTAEDWATRRTVSVVKLLENGSVKSLRYESELAGWSVDSKGRLLFKTGNAFAFALVTNPEVVRFLVNLGDDVFTAIRIPEDKVKKSL